MAGTCDLCSKGLKSLLPSLETAKGLVALRSMGTFPSRGSFSFGGLLDIKEKEHKREKKDETVNRDVKGGRMEEA